MEWRKFVANLGNLNVEMGHHYTYRGPIFAKEHLHETLYHLSYLIYGKSVIIVDGESFKVSSGDVIFIPPQKLHASFEDIETDFELVEAKFSTQDHLAEKLTLEFPFVVHIHNTAIFEPSLERFIEAYLIHGGKDWLTRIRLTEVLMLLAEEQSPHMFQSSAIDDMRLRIKQSVTYMSLHYYEPLTIDMLAELVNLSPSYFAGGFRKIMEVSPIEFLLRIRIQRVKELLLNSSRSISQIASECGFSSPKYLARIFMQREGMSPSSFRNKQS